MILRTLIITLFLSFSITSLGQIRVQGKVSEKNGSTELPGVNVVEKGTTNGTITDVDGIFSLTVSNLDVTLVFSFVGFVTKEVTLNGQDSIDVKMKSDCYIDTFDHQQLGIFLSSGVINTPVGGQIDFSFPAFFRSTTLSTNVNFQSDLEETELIQANIDFDHVILECDFQMDLKWNYRKLNNYKDFNSRAYSFEADFLFQDVHDLNIYNIGLIAGFTNLTFQQDMDSNSIQQNGLLIGVRGNIGKPLFPNVEVRTFLYDGTQEYQIKLDGGYRGFRYLINYYNINSFNEISIGIGYQFTYYLNRNAAQSSRRPRQR